MKLILMIPVIGQFGLGGLHQVKPAECLREFDTDSVIVGLHQLSMFLNVVMEWKLINKRSNKVPVKGKKGEKSAHVLLVLGLPGQNVIKPAGFVKSDATEFVQMENIHVRLKSVCIT